MWHRSLETQDRVQGSILPVSQCLILIQRLTPDNCSAIPLSLEFLGFLVKISGGIALALMLCSGLGAQGKETTSFTDADVSWL
jgi:hypothetical protein